MSKRELEEASETGSVAVKRPRLSLRKSLRDLPEEVIAIQAGDEVTLVNSEDERQSQCQGEMPAQEETAGCSVEALREQLSKLDSETIQALLANALRDVGGNISAPNSDDEGKEEPVKETATNKEESSKGEAPTLLEAADLETVCYIETPPSKDDSISQEELLKTSLTEDVETNLVQGQNEQSPDDKKSAETTHVSNDNDCAEVSTDNNSEGVTPEDERKKKTLAEEQAKTSEEGQTSHAELTARAPAGDVKAEEAGSITVEAESIEVSAAPNEVTKIAGDERGGEEQQ